MENAGEPCGEVGFSAEGGVGMSWLSVMADGARGSREQYMANSGSSYVRMRRRLASWQGSSRSDLLPELGFRWETQDGGWRHIYS